jgi:hypothetical protein
MAHRGLGFADGVNQVAGAGFTGWGGGDEVKQAQAHRSASAVKAKARATASDSASVSTAKGAQHAVREASGSGCSWVFIF